MKELDNELGFFGETEDMPDFEAEALAESPETPEVEEDATEEEESAEKPSQEEEKAELTPQEKFFWERLEEMASEDEYLANAMKKSDKSIRECFEYMTMLAKKKVTKQSGAQCVAVEGTEMLGWAVHYYTESKETIDSELHPKPKESPKSASKSATKKEEKKIHKNPLLEAIAKQGERKAEQSKSDKPKITLTKDGVKIEIAKNGERTTSVERNGQTYTMTELSLF